MSGATLSQRYQPLWAQCGKVPPTVELRGRRVRASCALDLLRSILALAAIVIYNHSLNSPSDIAIA